MAYYERPGDPIRVQYYNHSNAVPEVTPPSYQQQSSNEIEMARNTGRRSSVVGIVLAVFLGFLLLAAAIFSEVQLLQINHEITDLEKQRTDLLSENIRMQSELAGKTSNKDVQEYAENVLGMHEIDASQIEYIQIQTNDVVEIPEAEQNVFVKIKTWFDDLVEYIR